MLKQVFDREQLSKVLASSDVWQWDLLSCHESVEKAIDHTVQYWKSNDLALSPLERRIIKGKPVFIPAMMEDAFAIKLLDRFIRRIYKVRQSDRNRIIRQIIALLKDSGSHQVLRLDIRNCYEAIKFKNLINKFENELILAPACIRLLNEIQSDLWGNHGMHGLPRGLPISPTLSEIYLESLDKKLALHPDVIYIARYVDDIIILTPAGKENDVQNYAEEIMSKMGLCLNKDPGKYNSQPSNSAEFDYLGYSIKVTPKKNDSNEVVLRISKSKLNKIKFRIAISFCDYKRQRNISLLKRRLEYICMLKKVRKGKNGDLLAGIAYNYQYVTDGFKCLRPLDGFLCQQLTKPRFGLNQQEQSKIKKISIYGNAINRKIGKFSKKQTAQIMRVWKNA